MNTRVELSKIVEAMDIQSDGSSSYLDKNSGEVITLMDEEIRAAEDGDSLEDYPEWQHENIRAAQRLLMMTTKTFWGCLQSST